MIAVCLTIVIMWSIFATLYIATKSHKNYEKRNPQGNYYKRAAFNYGISTILAVLIVIFRDNLFTPQISWIPDLKTIIIYLLVLDCLIYWIHRITHRTPLLRKYLHETHHDVFYLLPMDFYNANISEYLIYNISMYIPLLFISIPYFDFVIASLIVFAHSVYTHCETDLPFGIPMFIDSTYHRYHHQIGKGNYSTYLTIWDEFMKTRIPTPPIDPVRKREEEEKQKENQETSDDRIPKESAKENTNL